MQTCAPSGNDLRAGSGAGGIALLARGAAGLCAVASGAGNGRPGCRRGPERAILRSARGRTSRATSGLAVQLAGHCGSSACGPGNAAGRRNDPAPGYRRDGGGASHGGIGRWPGAEAAGIWKQQRPRRRRRRLVRCAKLFEQSPASLPAGGAAIAAGGHRSAGGNRDRARAGCGSRGAAKFRRGGP